MSTIYPSSVLPLLTPAIGPLVGDVAIPRKLALSAGLSTDSYLSDIVTMRGSEFPSDSLKPLADFIAQTLQLRMPRAKMMNEPVTYGQVSFGMVASTLSARTENALLELGLQDKDDLSYLTVATVADAPGLGVRGILEFLAVAESVKGPLRPAANLEKKVVSRKLKQQVNQISKKRWASKIYEHDPRMRDFVININIHLAEHDPTVKQLAEILSKEPLVPFDSKNISKEFRRLSNKANELTKKTLKTEITQIIESIVANPRTSQIIVSRIGADGAGPKTLDEVGKAAGITRERVRQIEAKFLTKLHQQLPAWTPVLDKAINLVSRSSPISEKELQKLMKQQGLIWGTYSIDSLKSVAAIFEKDLDIEFDSEKGLVATKEFIELVPQINRVAVSSITHWGATTVSELGFELKKKGLEVEESQIIRALEYRDDLAWLNLKEGWFWLKKAPKNRILNYVEKIMSVAGQIEMNELRNGTGRWHRIYGYRLPKNILLALCLSTGLYTFEDDRLRGGDKLPDWNDVLTEGEKTIVGILFDNDNVMRRVDIEEKAVAMGLNRGSFYTYLIYSPVLERFAPGVYGLRGAPVTAARIEALIPQRQRARRIFRDNGWTQNGNMWLAYKVSRSSATSGVVGVPSVLAKSILGSYRLHTETGEPVGTITTRNSNMWGLSRFYRKWGIEVGDHIVVEFDSKTKSATVYAGDEELLSRFQKDSLEAAQV